jgi:TatD DNase family protein
VLVDTHCHLADPAYDADREAVLERAWMAGVGHVIAVGESRASAERAVALADRELRVSATAGLHPHDAAAWDAGYAAWMTGALRHSAVVAAGEMGLDYHYDHSPRPAQRAAFDAQLALAAAAAKPAVVHAREADDDVAAVLRNHPGVLRAGLVLGHYVSFSGMVTFRNAALDGAIRETPLDRMLVETDGPFLAPVPHRGSRNEPGYVRRVAERLATVLGLDPEAIIEVTGLNAARLFGPRLAVPKR